MKSSILLAGLLFVLSLILAIIQVWFTPWTAEIFVKIELTVGALLVIDVVLLYVIKEYKAYKSISQADQLD